MSALLFPLKTSYRVQMDIKTLWLPIFVLLWISGCFLFSPSTNEYKHIDAGDDDASRMPDEDASSHLADASTIDDLDSGDVDAGEEPKDAGETNTATCELISSDCFGRWDGGSTTEWGRMCRDEYEACVRG